MLNVICVNKFKGKGKRGNDLMMKNKKIINDIKK